MKMSDFTPEQLTIMKNEALHSIGSLLAAEQVLVSKFAVYGRLSGEEAQRVTREALGAFREALAKVFVDPK